MIKYKKKSYCWLDDFEYKTLADARAKLDDLIKEFGEETKLEVEYGWDSLDFYISVPKKETDAERLARAAKELAKKQKKEAADRVKFEKLKAEYGW